MRMFFYGRSLHHKARGKRIERKIKEKNSGKSCLSENGVASTKPYFMYTYCNTKFELSSIAALK